MMILCGFFCAGKSTLGKGCAQKLILPFYDTDDMIEEAYGKKKSRFEIWQEMGEESFRALETEMICSLKKEEAVVATGGGSLLKLENREHLKKLGTSIYLKASSLKTLYKRAQKKGFPAYLDREKPFEHFTQIAHERLPVYEEHCEWTLLVDGFSKNDLIDTLSRMYGI